MARLRTTLLALAVAGALALPAAASGAVTWVVNGAGYGHGVGMGAYGAYGYGKKGTDYRAILRHYYTGVRVSKVKRAPMVRVLLAIRAGDVNFTHSTRACGRRLSPAATYRAHRTGRSVRLLTRLGRLVARCGARLHADSNGVIAIRGVGPYRGALEVVPTSSSSGSLNVINALNVNNYVRGSLPGEIPPLWPIQTLKTFAVAIRSIALSTDVGGNGFELYADTRTQVYGGVKLESKRTDAAAQATRNQVVTYRGDIAQTVYSSSSGGQTESGFLGAPDVPYLQSVKDPYDFYSPMHRWTFRFSQAEMNSKLGGYLKGSLRRIVVTKRGDSPRIDYARLIGTRGRTRIRGDSLAAALGLYDRWAFFRRVR